MTTEITSPPLGRQTRSRLAVFYRLAVIALATIMVSAVVSPTPFMRIGSGSLRGSS